MRAAIYDQLAALDAGQVMVLEALAVSLNLPARHVASILSRIPPDQEEFRPWWRVVPSAGCFPPAAKRSRRQQVQVERLAQDGVTIGGDGTIAALEQRLAQPDMRHAGRIWLEEDGNP
jgi:methylated-DNA-protein-cysteine methyltransferase-like protein